ncbi:MAG TPA: hypothetical protein DD670_05715 [Planctomycetaceae bacterium]|nr:hypothetical protein [Planctomycetaceae bacterium]
MPDNPHARLLARFLDACEPYVVDIVGRRRRSPEAYVAPEQDTVPEDRRDEEATDAEVPATGTESPRDATGPAPDPNTAPEDPRAEEATEAETPAAGPESPRDEAVPAPDENRDLLRRLADEFSDEAILAAGIGIRGEDGVIARAPSLERSAGPLIALRQAADADPFCLVTRDGPTVPDTTALECFLLEPKTQQHLKDFRGCLLLTETVAQTAVLRALGLPAAPMTGIAQLNERRLRALLQQVRPAVKEAPACRSRKATPTAPSDADKKGAAEEAVASTSLILVGDFPLAGHGTDGSRLRATARFLSRAARMLDVWLPPVAVWLPGAGVRDDLEFAVRSDNLRVVHRVLLESLEMSSFSIHEFARDDFSPQSRAGSLAEASLAMSKLLHENEADGMRDERWADAIQQHNALVHEELVRPILAKIPSTGDPARRIAMAALAETCRQQHLRSPEILRGMTKDVVHGLDPAEQSSLAALFRQHGRSTAEILQLIKAIQNCY